MTTVLILIAIMWNALLVVALLEFWERLENVRKIDRGKMWHFWGHFIPYAVIIQFFKIIFNIVDIFS